MVMFRISAFVSLGLCLSGCAVNPQDEGQPMSIERHYERACDSASRSIDTLMVHWENPRSSERMPASQVIRAREAMSIIAPVCKDISVMARLDAPAKARVDAAFAALDGAARNLPRLPAGN